MPEINGHRNNPNQPIIYQIRIKGHLGPQWQDWFDGMTMTLEENGETVLTGPVADQPALHGLLKRVRDLGMNLVAVNHIDSNQGGALEFQDIESKSIDNFEQLSYNRRIEMNSINKTARIAGILYLAIFIIYPLATSVRSTLVVPGDPAATVQNIAANQTLFRWGMAGESVIFLIEILLAGFLYVLLRPVSRSVSFASALARASEGVVMAATNLFTSILTLVVIGGAGYLSVFDQEQQNALALLFQDANNYVILIWGLFFALHLVLLGWLVYRSGFFPKIPGILLALAGIGYFAQSFGVMVAPNLSDTLETVVIVLAIPGELVFALWLLIKGVDENKWHERALEASKSLV